MLLAVPISQVAGCQLIERAPRLDRVHLGEIWLRRSQHLEVVVLDRFHLDILRPDIVREPTPCKGSGGRRLNSMVWRSSLKNVDIHVHGFH